MRTYSWYCSCGAEVQKIIRHKIEKKPGRRGTMFRTIVEISPPGALLAECHDTTIAVCPRCREERGIPGHTQAECAAAAARIVQAGEDEQKKRRPR